MKFTEIVTMTEAEARAYFESIRWKDGVKCAHCGHADCCKLNGTAHREGLYKCRNRECRKQFSVTVGTIFHRSHFTLKQWLMGFHMMASSKKGVSALQLQRMLDIGSYKCAWHLAHRIRHVMANGSLATMLNGIVEADECYIGGKPRKYDGIERKRGRGTRKTPVVVLVERNGRARSKVIKRLNGKNLKQQIRDNVHSDSTIMTDEFKAYIGVGKGFAGGHKTVNHGSGEYARGNVHSNTAESYFALLKRGIVGSFHHVSAKHLHRYCNEFDFRWNHRDIKDSERFVSALHLAEGTRLMYHEPIEATE